MFAALSMCTSTKKGLFQKKRGSLASSVFKLKKGSVGKIWFLISNKFRVNTTLYFIKFQTLKLDNYWILPFQDSKWIRRPKCVAGISASNFSIQSSYDLYWKDIKIYSASAVLYYIASRTLLTTRPRVNPFVGSLRAVVLPLYSAKSSRGSNK